MSEEQFKAFIEIVKADTSLQEKLKAALDSDAVLTIAKEAGFSISADDLQDRELSEEELEGVAGGTIWGMELCHKFATNTLNFWKGNPLIPRDL